MGVSFRFYNNIHTNTLIYYAPIITMCPGCCSDARHIDDKSDECCGDAGTATGHDGGSVTPSTDPRSTFTRGRGME